MMDTYEKMVQWSRKLGYQGEMPKNLLRSNLIFNATTSPIWQQVLETVRPIEEVAFVRNNLIVSQLKCDKRETGNTVREIDVYNRKVKLERQLDVARTQIVDAEIKLDDAGKDNRGLMVRMDNVKLKIKESEQKAYVYAKKCEDLRNQIASAEDRLNHCKRLTPVEDEFQGSVDVSENLKKCAAKIQMAEDEKLRMSLITNSLNIEMNPDESLGIIDEDVIQMADFDTKLESRDVDPVRDLLSKHSKVALWKALRSVEEDLRTDLKECVARITSLYDDSDGRQDEWEQMSKLHVIHIENKLRAIKYGKEVRSLEKQVRESEQRFLNAMVEKNYSAKSIDDTKTLLVLEKEDLIHTTALIGMKSALQQLESYPGSKDEIRRACDEDKKLKELIHSSINSLQQKEKLLNDHILKIQSTCQHTCTMVSNLKQFRSDLSWLQPLGDNFIGEEIRNFSRLHFHRKASPTPYFEDLDAVAITNLVALSDCPMALSGKILTDLLRKKKKLQLLRSQRPVRVECVQRLHYSAKDFADDGAVLVAAMDGLAQIAKGGNQKSTQMAKMREAVRIWLEMPMKDYVQSARLFDGFDYKHYEAAYDKYYEML